MCPEREPRKQRRYLHAGCVSMKTYIAGKLWPWCMFKATVLWCGKRINNYTLCAYRVLIIRPVVCGAVTYSSVWRWSLLFRLFFRMIWFRSRLKVLKQSVELRYVWYDSLVDFRDGFTVWLIVMLFFYFVKEWAIVIEVLKVFQNGLIFFKVEGCVIICINQ